MSDPLPSNGYGIEEFAADALAVMDAVGFDRAAILAEGMDGATAVWLAVHCPERVNGLILCGASSCIRTCPGQIGLAEPEVTALREVFRTRGEPG
jgi:pimeloyl-ACP methyl ester carboxylesterase